MDTPDGGRPSPSGGGRPHAIRQRFIETRDPREAGWQELADAWVRRRRAIRAAERLHRKPINIGRARTPKKLTRKTTND